MDCFRNCSKVPIGFVVILWVLGLSCTSWLAWRWTYDDPNSWQVVCIVLTAIVVGILGIVVKLTTETGSNTKREWLIGYIVCQLLIVVMFDNMLELAIVQIAIHSILMAGFIHGRALLK